VTATGVNKVYDGTVTATVTLSDNRVAGDVFTASYGSASFTSSAVGNGKTVNVSGISLAGTDAGNYTLGNTTAATTANITAGTPSIALVSSDNPSGFHDAITFTATLPADATGTVAFSTNGVAFSSGSLSGGTFTSGSISNLLRGTNLITATYTSGDANYSSTAGSLSQVVTNHPPITGLFSFSVTNGNALKLQVSTLLSAVFDPDGDAVSLVGIGVSTNGVTLATNATMIYYRNTNYVNDLFSYTVYDGYNYTTGQVSVVSVTAPFLIGSASNGTITPNGVSNAVVFNGVPGFTYVIQRSTDIVHWTDIATQAAAADGTIQFNDSFTDLGSAPSQAFYRLKWQP